MLQGLGGGCSLPSHRVTLIGRPKTIDAAAGRRRTGASHPRLSNARGHGRRPGTRHGRRTIEGGESSTAEGATVRPIVAELVGALGVTIASALLIAGGGFGGGPMTGGSSRHAGPCSWLLTTSDVVAP